MYFQDKEAAKKIMLAKNPRDMKILGRKVKGFDKYVWNKICKNVVRKGSIEKYSQNIGLKKMLFKTAGTLLVEASPSDRIWG